MLRVDGAPAENSGIDLKIIDGFGGKIACVAVAAALRVDFGVAPQVIHKALGHNGALCQQADVRRQKFVYVVDKQRVMRAAKYDGVNVGIGGE